MNALQNKLFRCQSSGHLHIQVEQQLLAEKCHGALMVLTMCDDNKK